MSRALVFLFVSGGLGGLALVLLFFRRWRQRPQSVVSHPDEAEPEIRPLQSALCRSLRGPRTCQPTSRGYPSYSSQRSG